MESANHEFTYLSGRAQLSVAHEAKCHDESSVVKIEKPRPTPHPRHQNTIKEPVDNIQSTSSSPSVAPARPIPLPRIIKVFTTPSPVYDEPSKLQSSVFYIATPKNTNPSTIDRSIISEFDPILQRADACSRNSTFYIEPPKSKPVVPDCRNRISSEQVSHFDNPDGVSTTLPKSEGVICQNLLSMNSTVKSTCADFKTNDVLPEPQNDDSSPDFLGSASFLCGSSLSSFSSNSISNSISTSNYNTALSDSEGDPFLSNTASHFNKNEELSVASNSSSENSNALDADKDVESFDRSTGSLSDSPPPPNGPPPFFDYHIEEELPPPLPPRPTPGISPHMTGTEISSSQSQTILQATCATSAIKQPLKCTLSSVPPSPLSSNLITDAVETHVQQCPSQSMLVENPVYLFFESESTSLSFSRINDISKEVKKGCDSDSCESNSCDFESGEPPQFPPPPLPMQSSDSCNSSSPDPSRPSPENSLSTLHPNSLVFSPAKLSYLNNEELQSTKPCDLLKMSNGSYHIGLYQNVLEGETREGVYAMIKKPVQQSSDQLVLSPPPLPPRGQQRPFPTQPVPSHFCHPLVADAKKGTVDKLPDCPKKTAKDAALFTLISNIPRYGILYRFGRGSKDVSQKWIVLERGHLQCYADDKTDCPQDVFHKSDIISVAKGADAKYSNQELFCFEVVTRTSKDRPEIFGARYLSECDSWMQHIIQAIAPIPEAVSYRTIFKAGYAQVRLSVTSVWQERWIVLKEKCLNVTTDTDDDVVLDLRKVISIQYFEKDPRMNEPEEEVPLFLITYPATTLYVRSVRSFDTPDWFSRIKDVVYNVGPLLEDQQMTLDGIPVIVDKCINFISTYGITSKGIYRHSSTNSRISTLLKIFFKDAHKVHLKIDDYSEYDVANVLKRFFRNLPEPVMTKALYSKWIAMGDRSTSDHYSWLLSQLPEVNYLTLKQLIGHLYSVSKHSGQNLMTIKNLSQVFGPTLLAVENDISMENATTEIVVMVDLITNFPTLFGVSTEEIEKEERIQKALRNIREAKKAQKPAGDILVGIYVYHRQWGTCLNMKLSPTMTTLDVCVYAAQQIRIKDPIQNLSVFEVVCDGELERPLHHSDVVLSVTLRWARWSDADAKDNYLVIKRNELFETVLPLTRQPLSMFGELRMADIKSKSFKKCMFEFKNAKLAYYKDAKISQPLGSWNIEDLTWYVGYESRRQPPTRWALTFIEQNAVVRRRTKESPYFGYTICFCSEDEFHKWVATLLIGQYPNGIFPRYQPLDLLS